MTWRRAAAGPNVRAKVKEAIGELAVDVRSVDGVLVARVEGDVDLDTSERFEERLAPLRHGDGPAVVDLGRAGFFDSNGLHVVVGLWRALGGRGRALAVACPPGPVRKLFELTAVERIVPIYGDAGEAVRALRERVSAPAP